MDQIRGKAKEAPADVSQRAKNIILAARPVVATRIYNEFMPSSTRGKIFEVPGYKFIHERLEEIRQLLEKTFSKKEDVQGELDVLLLEVRYMLAVLSSGVQVHPVNGIKLLKAQ